MRPGERAATSVAGLLLPGRTARRSARGPALKLRAMTCRSATDLVTSRELARGEPQAVRRVAESLQAAGIGVCSDRRYRKARFAMGPGRMELSDAALFPPEPRTVFDLDTRVARARRSCHTRPGMKSLRLPSVWH